MFNFGSNENLVEVTPKIRRLVDLTTPNRPVADNIRTCRRFNRCLPIVLGDWSDSKGTDMSHIGLGFTTDLSDGGFGVLTQHKPRTPDNVVAFYLPDDMDLPWYFHSQVTTYRKEPGGFHRLGYSIVNSLKGEHRKCGKMNEIVIDLLTVKPDA